MLERKKGRDKEILSICGVGYGYSNASPNHTSILLHYTVVLKHFYLYLLHWKHIAYGGGLQLALNYVLKLRFNHEYDLICAVFLFSFPFLFDT